MRTTVAVRWSDEDGFGHVNNAAFLTYAEEGRDRLLTSLLGEESVWDVVIVRIEVDYRAEVTHRDAAVDVDVRGRRGRPLQRAHHRARDASGRHRRRRAHDGVGRPRP